MDRKEIVLFLIKKRASSVGKITIVCVYLCREGVPPKSVKWYTSEEENSMKKKMHLLNMLLAIVGIGMLLLAGAVHLGPVLIIGIAILIVAVVAALVIAFIEGKGNDTGSYRIPRI